MSDAPRDRGLQGLLIGLLLAVFAAIGWRISHRDTQVEHVEQGAEAPNLEGVEPLALAVPLTGRVLLEGADEQSPLEPAATCVARAWRDGVLVGQEAQCDAAGNVELSLPSAGRLSVELEAPGRLRAVVTVDVPEQGGVLPTVALGRAQTIRGHVVDERGEPVAGVVVQARPNPDLDEPEPWRRTTDDEGAFVFDTLPPGPVALRCDEDGYAPTVVEAIAPQHDVLLTLGGIFAVRGRVLLTQDGQEATVRLEGSGVWPARSVVAKPDGSFEVPEVPDGVYALEAVVEAEGEGDEFASVPLEGVEPDMEVTLALVPAHRVAVRVEDPSGEPLAGARVTMTNAQVGMLARTIVTDERGEASVGPVVPGPYVVRADADGYLASAPAAVGVPLEDSTPIVLRLARPARIVATVLLPDGSPVSGATVVLGTDAVFSVGEASARAETFTRTLVASGTLGVTEGPVPAVPNGSDAVGDAWRKSGASGRVAFDGLVPGLYRVHAQHGEFASSAPRELRLGGGEEASVTLTLREGQRLTGRVRDENDRPIDGAVIMVDGAFVARTDDRGVFDAGPHLGNVTVRAHADGFATTVRKVFIDADPIDVEMALVEADGVLEGRVVGPNDRPLEGASISVHPGRGRGASQQMWTDARGLWSFDGLPRGDVAVEVTHPQYVAVERTVQVGRQTEVDIAMREGWSLDVVVRWQGTREPVVGAKVSADGTHARTDDDGQVRLDGLDGARVRVEVEAAGAPSVSRSVGRDAGSEIIVELVEGGAVRGTVTDYRGDAVPRASVEVYVGDDDEPWATTRTGGRGRFSFDGLPQGPIELVANPPAARSDDLDSDSLSSDVLRGHVTREVMLRLDRR